MFVLHTHTGKQIQLKWGTYSMSLYCERAKTDLSGLFDELSKLQYSIPVLVNMIQSSSEAATGFVPEYKEVCEWIDDCGGMLAKNGPLVDFVNYVVKNTIVNVSQEEEEKKSEQNA